MSVQGVNDGFGLIIPNLDSPIIGTGQNVRFITGRIIVNAIDTTFMSLEGVMRSVRAEAPDLDGSIQRCRSKGVAVLGVKLDLHDVMGVSFKHLGTIKATFPVPQLDSHVIRRRKDVGEGRMDFEGTNVIGMSFEFLDFLHGIVVEDTNAHIIRSSNEPLFARNEFGASHRQLAQLKGLDATASFVVPNHNITAVKCRQDPWF
mmetsp:Transcript_28668/g.47449  ORF Transcript_28668/g.47449 Transcript_28668/m.47449 type:complete len:203 (+) Transcript_28668:1098-1706(+)